MTLAEVELTGNSLSTPEVHFRCSNLKLFCKQAEAPSRTDTGVGVMRELSEGKCRATTVPVTRDGAEEHMETAGTPQSSSHAEEKNP